MRTMGCSMWGHEVVRVGWCGVGGVVWCGVGGVVWCGVVWCGVVWCGVVWVLWVLWVVWVVWVAWIVECQKCWLGLKEESWLLPSVVEDCVRRVGLLCV